ncbi:glycosyltransferase [Roseivivax lentus]|uniref:glycosyltransferase n=1 Tax=Roseivivax lentus TaxID=633194 RepID=UPI000970BA54|nr:glycosyltransferase [Roseivivax lentus]
MIFLTIGTQLPFPRLTEAMDHFASVNDEQVVAQIGEEKASRPHLDVRSMIPPNEFGEMFQRARVIVAHAGIGTVLSACRYRRPLILVPRRHDLGEHRNDHQVATAHSFEGTPGLYVAWDVSELPRLLTSTELVAPQLSQGRRHASLVRALADFISLKGPEGSAAPTSFGRVSQPQTQSQGDQEKRLWIPK